MEKLKMGIVGAGVWGKTHAKIYEEHPLAETVAICDLDKSKAEALAAIHGVTEVYTDHREMLEKSDCDVVAIVTPDFLHAEIAINCANAGKHMLIEKPLATKRDEVFAMLEAIEKNNVRAMVDLHNRWNPPVNTAKQAIDAGELGEIYSAYMRLNDMKWVPIDMLSWSAQSSILWFLGSHSIDTLSWLVGSRVKRVYSVSREGLLKAEGVDVPDMYLTTLEFENGCIAHMENGWITPDASTNINDVKYTLLGTKGMISMDCSSHNMIQKITDRVTTPDVIVGNTVFGSVKGFAYETIRSFIDRMIDGKPFDVSLKDAANASLALLAVLESAKTRMPVEVNYDK